MYDINHCVTCMPPGVSVDSAPFHLSLLSNMPAVILLSPVTMHHLVIDQIPPVNHLTHIPDLQTGSHKDNHQDPPLLLPFDKESPTVHVGAGLPPVPRSQSSNRGRTFCRVGRSLSSYWDNDDQIESKNPSTKLVTAS